MSQVVEQSSVELVLNEAIAEFRRSDAAIAAIRDEYMGYHVAGVDDEDGYKLCKSARLNVVKMRTAAEKKKDELKRPALDFGRAVDAELRRLKGLIEPIENHLRSQESIVDDEKKRIEAEKLAAEKVKLDLRVAALAEYGESMPIDELRVLPDWKFDAMVSNAKAAKEERDKLQAEENERRRIEAERLESQRKELDEQREALERQRKELEAKTVVDDSPVAVVETASPVVESSPIVATAPSVDMAEIRRQFVKIKWKLHEIVDNELPDFKRAEAAEILNVASRSLMALVQ